MQQAGRWVMQNENQRLPFQRILATFKLHPSVVDLFSCSSDAHVCKDQQNSLACRTAPGMKHIANTLFRPYHREMLNGELIYRFIERFQLLQLCPAQFPFFPGYRNAMDGSISPCVNDDLGRSQRPTTAACALKKTFQGEVFLLEILCHEILWEMMPTTTE